ncbi:MAG: cyclic nucleotide-binding domain-containing protein [Aphanothece sp. CMT-3BRIN-NPC111]|jgi:bacteriocin-type transport-associated protein|nr:cyclic nucleotide-binding domain-containing protein [Aphanothece sp. CMT-3BRIN-NPC111]
MSEVLSNFGQLSNSDINWITSTGKQEEIPPNKVLIQEGQPIDSLYLLLNGTLVVSVSQQGSTEADKEIARLSNGEMIGEMSLVDERPPSATVKTLLNSKVLSLSKRQLVAKLEQDEDFAGRFYQMLSVKLSQRLRGLSDLLARSQIVPGHALRKVLFVFAVLNDSDIDWMIAKGRREKISPGTVLIHEERLVEALYILIEGSLTVSVSTMVNGEKLQQEIAKLASGEIVGEMSFVEGGQASATVKSGENSLLLALPQQELAAKLQQDRGFAARFYRAIAVLLVDRLRDRMVRRGFSRRAYEQNQLLAADIEYEDELDLDVLEHMAIAGARFDWMIKRLRKF